MSFKTKFKQDKSFRWKVIIIFALVIFGLGQASEDKKTAASVAMCDSFNTGGYLLTTPALTMCEAEGCVVLMPQSSYDRVAAAWLDYIPGASQLISLLNLINVETDLTKCVYVAPDATLIYAASQGEANSQCSSGSAILYDDKWVGDDVYKCRPGEACSSSFQRSVGNILDSVWATHPFEDCKTKFYAVAFGGGFLVVLLLLVAL